MNLVQVCGWVEQCTLLNQTRSTVTPTDYDYEWVTQFCIQICYYGVAH